MQIEELRRFLQAAHEEGLSEPAPEAEEWLRSAGVTQRFSWQANLRRMAEVGVPLDLLAGLCDQFHDVAPSLADADMAWNNLERFITSARNPLSTTAFFERDAEALPNLLQLLSTSQYLADVLAQDQECYDLIRMTEGRPVARDLLVEELVAAIEPVVDPADAMALLRRTKRRETIRVAYGDIVRGQAVATVARQISFLADALVEAALAYQRRRLEAAFGVPRDRRGAPARFCVLALGKLGGIELNYSSDIDLIFFYDGEGHTDAPRSIRNREFFERLGRDLVKLLGETTDLGIAYRVDLRLRPEGARGPVCLSFEQMLSYYDTKARTWERQAFIKARPIAGHLALGDDLLRQLEPWVYRRYLSLTDITGIKGIKRRIEQAARNRAGERDVKTGSGGIRDIEFVIQFLQLLNGGALPEVRTGNTFEALTRLEKVGCLTPQERQLLEDNYSMLRKLEHRLQIMYDVQTHTLPSDEADLRKLAVRMGYTGTPHRPALSAFQADFRERTGVNRKILDHLMHDAFEDDRAQEPEVDLVNDPDPTPERINEVLGRYGFDDVPSAYANLMALADEKIRFLSTRRARHFLASIAPRLLQAIARTPEPDTTLVNLSRVSDSLGGKSALWELLSTDRPTLNLYVTLCAACPYLADTLTSNPGMIDELLDSLLVDHLPTAEMLDQTLADLARGAEDLDPILHSFKNAQHLRVGVRDILGRDDISATHRALSDIAEICVRQIADRERGATEAKFGLPRIELPADDADVDPRFADRDGDECELVILALGKLGGREPNYHSDLDLIFLYEADGHTDPGKRGRGTATTNGHFFSQLGQRIIQLASRLGPHGRLYEVDARLRPTGKSGPLAVSFEAFERYYTEGIGQLWERQALCKARVIYGSERAAAVARAVVDAAAYGPGWRPEHAADVRNMRYRLEDSASPRNLKRGRGGTVDTEFLVQMLQLRHGLEHPSIRKSGTLEALTALEEVGLLPADDAEFFRESYRFQRSVEARIRLMNSAGRHEVPTDERELGKLAFLLGYADPRGLERRALELFEENRRRFDRLFDEAAG